MALVTQAGDGTRGFDIDQPLTATQAASMLESGFTVCMRYIGRVRGVAAGDLTPDETQTIIASGLGLMPVQHVAGGGGFWSITDGLGAAWGSTAAYNATNAGIEPGANVWLDLEQIQAGTAHATIIQYCNDWFNAVSAVGFVPGVYVGSNAWLTPSELYGLNTQHYWRAAGDIPDISTRGYQITQSLPRNVNGLSIDVNTIAADRLGGLPLMMVSGAAGAIA
jgi:hypothetical protein